MSEIWLSLTNLPEEGQEFSYSEQEIWSSPIEEFELPYSILEPIQSRIVVFLREKGCFVNGTIKGKIALPCSRCAEDLSFQFEERINIVELLPEEKKLEDEVVYDLAELFKTMGNPTRIKILYALKERDLCVCDLSELLDMSSSAISHQLRILRNNKLVKYRKEGRSVYYSLDDRHVICFLGQGLSHILEDR